MSVVSWVQPFCPAFDIMIQQTEPGIQYIVKNVIDHKFGIHKPEMCGNIYA